MGKDQLVPLSIDNIKKIARPLFEDIIHHPGIYSSATNPLVEPIHQAWKAIQPETSGDTQTCHALANPDNFVKTVARDTKKVTLGQIARGLRHRVGRYVTIEVEERAIETVYKTGRFKDRSAPPVGQDWQLTQTNSLSDTYVKRVVLDEICKLPPISIYDTGFHATTSAALPGIEYRGAILSSSRLQDNKDQLYTGEVFGSIHGYVHREVFVHVGKIADGYGVPGWFGEYSVVFGISINKQREYLAKQGKEFGLWSNSDGAQIGEDVPLENITTILVDASKLDEVKKWAKKNCPSAHIASREAIYLAYKK